MDSNYPSIVLKAGKERSLLARHPWVFSGAILKQPKGLEEGTIVKVYQNDGSYLATGQFHKNTITVRCIDFENSEINQLFWNDKIAKAYNMRTALNYIGQSHSNSYRIIHGEGDGLPGLVIDIYNQIAIVQCYTKGMYDVLDSISNAIKNVYGKSLLAIYNKSSETLAKHGVTDTKDGYLWRDEGYSESTIALENEIQYKIDYVNGQKTGFFLDQRENRALLKYYSKGKKVLNTFSYSGGFSLNALKGGASSVVSVDSSKKAIESLNENLQLNGFSESSHQSVTEDVMTYLKSNTDTFDLIVLDPPAYAKHLSQVKNAMIGYRNLNTAGIKTVKSGGIIFTFSCSQAVDKELFRKIIFQSALQAKRKVKILHQLSQPQDHPINIYHPETEYLKGLVLYIE